MKVSILFNLVTTSGRLCVEVRQAQKLGKGVFSPSSRTMISFPYDEQDRNLYVSQAFAYCRDKDLSIVEFHDCKFSRHASI